MTKKTKKALGPSPGRKPKVPVRPVTRLPEPFQTLVYYDEQGKMFCIQCNLTFNNYMLAKCHCLKHYNYHYRVNKERTT